MISLKIIHEYHDINCINSSSSSSSCVDLLPKLPAPDLPTNHLFLGCTVMAEHLHTAINSLSLHDEEPVDLPDNPSFHVYEENAMSLLGRLLNPDFQPMDKMIETMPQIWRVYDRVRGIALSRDKFQFIFKREEDMMTVLNDRPWTYNNWTMLLDRWIPSPPVNFLTTVDVWVRIRNIPMNHYRIETIDFLASKIGHVVEIAYDPKASQKEAYIRALVRLNIANPAIAIKPLNLPSGGRVIIEFEYEKLRKRCFHCQRLTHERPSCPFVTKKAVAKEPRDRRDVNKSLMKQIEPPSSSQLRPLPTKPSSQHLSIPPGFAPLFPELPIEERNAALLYILHSDATERQARILRVQQSLAPGFVEPTVAKPIISHDLNKGKGHVFVFQENDRPLKRSSTVTDVPGNHERTPLRAHSNSIYDFSDHEASSASSPPGSTGFLMGSSSGNPPSGTRSEGRKNRRRPQRWKRIKKSHLHAASGPDKDDSDTGLCRSDHGLLPLASTTLSKRKTPLTAEEQLPKSSKTTLPSVASDLKPLTSQ